MPEALRAGLSGGEHLRTFNCAVQSPSSSPAHLNTLRQAKHSFCSKSTVHDTIIKCACKTCSRKLTEACLVSTALKTWPPPCCPPLPDTGQQIHRVLVSEHCPHNVAPTLLLSAARYRPTSSPPHCSRTAQAPPTPCHGPSPSRYTNEGLASSRLTRRRSFLWLFKLFLGACDCLLSNGHEPVAVVRCQR